MTWAFSGDASKAEEMFRKSAEVEGREFQLRSAILAMTGRVPEARKRREDWERQHPDNAVNKEDPLDVARLWAVIGDLPKTLLWLERTWAVRGTELVWLKIDPRFRKVRAAPEFQAILRRMGL